MDTIIQSLTGLLAKALPTVFLFLLLHFYLRAVFFQPMSKMLQERFELTEGARRRGEEALAHAELKAKEYEEALRGARGELYVEQEAARRQLQEECDAQIVEARKQADAQVVDAKQALMTEVASLKGKIEADAEILAGQIADSMLRGRAA